MRSRLAFTSRAQSKRKAFPEGLRADSDFRANRHHQSRRDAASLPFGGKLVCFEADYPITWSGRTPSMTASGAFIRKLTHLVARFIMLEEARMVM